VRDVGEDAVRGRIYLPVNELQRFDVKAHELIKRGAAPGTDTADFHRASRP
jgi:15-cis-phytoene synthase